MTKFLSVCAFFVAMSCFSLQTTTRSIRISVGIAASIVGVLIIWCIINLWDFGVGDSKDHELIIDEDELDNEGYEHERNTT